MILQKWKAELSSTYPTLAPIAIRVFSAAGTSASTERNFSALAFLKSKLRNRLSQEKLDKICYIRSNVELLDQAFADNVIEISDSGEESE